MLQPTIFCKKITIIKNSKNAGVGYAYNQGQQVSFNEGLEFTAFCNNDLYFSTDWLIKLENRMDGNQNVAMLSPLRPSAKVRYDSDTSTRDKLFELPETDDWVTELKSYTGLPIERFDEFSRLVSRVNRDGEVEIIIFPDSLSTCVCLTRNSVFRTLGYFSDPRFTVYGGEDIDMSWTIMSMGYDCAVDHDVYVHHFRGKSLKSNNMKRQVLLKRASKILYTKWKDVIQEYIVEKRSKGIDIAVQIRGGRSGEYWLLFELDQYEKFLENKVYA
jgi:GT2 family glycosyltransferase